MDVIAIERDAKTWRETLTQVEVDLGAVARNFASVQRLVHPSEVWAVIKGDGYGLGLERTALALAGAGAKRFVVRGTDEAARLRRAGIGTSILSLAPGAGEVDNLIELGVGIGLGTFEQLERVIASVRHGRHTAAVHVEVDSGLGRGGFLPSEVGEIKRRISSLSSVKICTVWSHLADARDRDRSMGQLSTFLSAASLFPGEIERHLSNSAGLDLGREFFLDAVRPGLAIYGIQPGSRYEPAFKWTGKIGSVYQRPAGFRVGYGAGVHLGHDSVLATVLVGFADGYPRLSEGVVGVNGTLAPILGPVTMNSMVLDISACPPTRQGDEVVLLGPGGPSIDMLVERSKPAVISNMFSCAWTASVARRYHGDVG